MLVLQLYYTISKFVVTNEDGKEVMRFESTEDGVDITGKLVVGKTYTFTEVSAPKGYMGGKPVKYTVKDTDEVQKVSVVNERIPKEPKVPQTGTEMPVIPMAVAFFTALGVAFFVSRKRKVVKK